MPRFTIEADPLPPNFVGTPQQFFDAILRRLRIGTDLIGFVISDTAPSYNRGVWLKDGKEIWVWDDDQAQYVPLDVSASVRDEIHIGDNPPESVSDQDPTPRQQLWLRISGTQVEGLYWWAGTVLGWVRIPAEVRPGTIQTEHIRDGAVTPPKLSGAIPAERLADNLPVAKLAPGVNGQVLRTVASTSQWAPLLSLVADQAVVLNQKIEVSHTLGVVPNYLRAVLRCIEAEHGFPQGIEIDLGTVAQDNSRSILYATAAHVGVFILSLQIPALTGGVVNLTPTRWRVVFYVGNW